MNTRIWMPGDPAPDFQAACGSKPRFTFHTTAGRYIVLSFLGSANAPEVRRAVEHIERNRTLFDDDRLAFFGVSADPGDEHENRLCQMIPGIRYFRDFDMAVSRLYGAAAAESTATGQYRPFTLVLDPMLRVLAHIPLLPSVRLHACGRWKNRGGHGSRIQASHGL